MKKIVFNIHEPYYNCNRTRQLDYLVSHGFKPINAIVDENGRTNWIFKADQDLVNCLNDFVRDVAINKCILYELICI